MSGLVGYQYDDSDDESRRNSTSKGWFYTLIILRNLYMKSFSEEKSPESSPESMNPQSAEPMEVDKKEESPEVVVIENPEEPKDSEKSSRLRSPPPQQMGYYEQMRQKGSPVPCSEEMLEKYELLFTQKARGIPMDKYLDDIKTFKNPALYDLLLQKFDIETHGSNLTKNAKLFDLNGFEEHDYYDKLGNFS